MIQASYKPYTLHFKRASGTSRGILKTKETWFICLTNEQQYGVGECGMFRGLSVDDRPDYEIKLQWVCKNIHLGLNDLLIQLVEFPSIQFGLEMAFSSLESSNPFELFPSNFTNGQTSIPINGLIWMGSEAYMKQQIKEKIESGFDCIKMKIGALDFQTELNVLKSIRNEFSAKDLILRVDANGAFSASEALESLKQLAAYDLHSIEQPIKQSQVEEMAQLCAESPLPIALDEELIGCFYKKDKQHLLQTIKPQYVILKPTLVGGIEGSNQWIDLAEQHDIGWWITSALESNVGLNAIAQYTYTKSIELPQGLGTGGLFTNNFEGPLEVIKGHLHYHKSKTMKFSI